MYAVFQSGKRWSNLSDAISARLLKNNRVSIAEESIESIKQSVDFTFNSKKLDSGIHSKKPCKQKVEKNKFY